MKKNIKKIFKILNIFHKAGSPPRRGKYLIFLFIFLFFLGLASTAQAIPFGSTPVTPPSAGGCVKDEDCDSDKYCVPASALVPANCYLKKNIGEECERNAQCQSGECKVGQGGKKYCVKAGTDEGAIKWQPIAPVLQINIPTLQPFTTSGMAMPDAEGYVYIPFIGQYLAGIYKWAVGIAGLVAVVLIIIGGFIYLTAGGNAQRASEGKERITHAVFGLVLLLGSYLLLYTINPDLVRFKSLKIKVIERVELNTTATYLDLSDADAAVPGTGTNCVPLFKQKDYENVPYGLDPKTNVMTSGCGPTALAMILQYYNKKDIDPGKLATIIMQNKEKYVSPLGTTHKVFTDEFLGQFGFNAKNITANEIAKHLKEKHPILSTMKSPSIFTKKGHFIVITGVNDNGTLFSVNDPNKSFYCTNLTINFPKHPDNAEYYKTHPQPPKDLEGFSKVCEENGGQIIMPNAVPATEIINNLSSAWYIYPQNQANFVPPSSSNCSTIGTKATANSEPPGCCYSSGAFLSTSKNQCKLGKFYDVDCNQTVCCDAAINYNTALKSCISQTGKEPDALIPCFK